MKQEDYIQTIEDLITAFNQEEEQLSWEFFISIYKRRIHTYSDLLLIPLKGPDNDRCWDHFEDYLNEYLGEYIDESVLDYKLLRGSSSTWLILSL